MDWFFIQEEEPFLGAENMARDQHILELVESGQIPGAVLRVYRWARPTLSMGYNQQWERTIVLDAIRQYGFDLVRRWTGGRAVLHIDEITYSVVAPFKAPFLKTVNHNYRILAGALENFTSRLFLKVQLAGSGTAVESHTDGLRSTPCFATVSESEIQSGERKLIGSSQKLGRAGFLQHGSIPIRDHARELCALTGSNLDMSTRMDTLGGLLQRHGRTVPDFGQLSSFLKQSFQDIFQMEFSLLDIQNRMDSDRIRTLIAEQFGNDNWTYKR